MQTRGLGKTGLQVSELCMGCWEIGGLFWGPMDVKDAQRLLRGAYDAGVNAYDLADVYGNGRSECLVGRTVSMSGWGPRRGRRGDRLQCF